jgi:dolichol-phosphate mannosyltransferase
MSIDQPLSRPAISVVAPCYNEEESLPELHRRVSAVCAGLGKTYEIVLVNDGSKDRTWEIMQGLALKDSHIVAINLSRNHGHELALTAGLNMCRGDRVMLIDADLQDPPELLPDMMKVIDGGADVVYGQRRTRDGETAFKKATSAMFYRALNRMVDVDIPNDTGDFRLMTRQVVDEFNRLPERMRFVRGMISWVGFEQVPLFYDRDKRFAGETKYNVGKLLLLAIDAATSFSTVPLKLATWLGGIFAMLSMVGLVYAVVSYFLGAAIQGWTSMIIILLMLSGVQLVVMGIIGEYLGRLYMESKGRSLFIVKDIVSSSASVPTKAPHDLIKG